MKNEERTNAKHASADTQYSIRKTIVRLLKTGKTGKEIAKLLDVSEGHVSGVKKAYKTGGIAAIKPKKHGRKVGEKRTLTPQQERAVQLVLVDKTPEQMRFKECMWTRSNIRDLIREMFKINMPLSTLGYYLERWGFSIQRPVKRAYKQDEKKVKDWVEREFPGISASAKSENAEIFFGDETGVHNTAAYQRGYAPVGKTPVVRTESMHIKINMMSAISAKGKLRFVLYKDNMNADKLIDFMRRLIRDAGRKVYLVLDNLRVHHAKKTMEWVKAHESEIALFFLPPYAPEYNPDELLNGDLKRGIGKRPSPRSVEELTHNVRSHMKKVQLNKKKIQGFFGSKTTSYAA